MDKIFLELSEPEKVEIKFEGKKITVKPFLTVAEEIDIINTYMQTYFLPNNNGLRLSNWDLISAEHLLIAKVLLVCTNIDVADEQNNITIDTGKVILSGLWDTVKDKIINYQSMREHLYHILEDAKLQVQMAKELGSVLEEIFENLNGTLENFKNLDTSDEGIAKIKELVLGAKEAVSSQIIQSAYKDAQIEKKSNRGRKKKVA